MNFNIPNHNRQSRSEIIHIIEMSLKQLNDKELDALYYDLLTKDYIKV